MDTYEIYDQYYRRVRRFILSYVRNEWTADDLTQETFIRVQKSLGMLQAPERLTSWIFRIAYNICRDHFRRCQIAAPRECELAETMEARINAIAQQGIEQCEMSKCVQGVVNMLPESFRSVIILFDFGELSHREIAEILDISVDNVKVRLHRGRKKLKVLLAERCTFEIDERDVLICLPMDCGEQVQK